MHTHARAHTQQLAHGHCLLHTRAVEAVRAVHDDVVIRPVRHHALDLEHRGVDRKRVGGLTVALAGDLHRCDNGPTDLCRTKQPLRCAASVDKQDEWPYAGSLIRWCARS